MDDKIRNRQRKISEIVGANMRKLRVLSRYSQEQLGDALGLTFQQVQKYEKGANRVSAPVLIEMADLFGVNVTEFFAGCASTSKETGTRKDPIPDVTPHTIELAEKLNRLPSGKARDGLFSLVDALSD